MQLKCPVCGKAVDNLRTAVKGGQYISERCGRCLVLASGSSLFNRKYDRDRQREDYRKDLIQNWEEDFPRAYGGQAALDKGWNLEDIRKYGG